MSFLFVLQMFLFGMSTMYVMSTRNSCRRAQMYIQEQEYLSDKALNRLDRLDGRMIFLEEEMKRLYVHTYELGEKK